VLDRTTKRHRLLGSAAMLLAAMSVSACGDSTTPEAAKPATAAPPPTSKAVPTQTAAQRPPMPRPTDASAPGSCKAADLRLEISASPKDSDSANYLIVVLNNVSNRRCTVQGFPGVDLVGPDDPVDGPTYSLPEQQVQAKLVTIPPGQAAGSELTYLKGGETDWMPKEVVVTPPGLTTPLRVPWPGTDPAYLAGTVVRQDPATHPGTFVGPLGPLF